MLKRLLIFKILFLVSSPAWAWVTGSAVGEIRVTATAGGLNGGWFDPTMVGTDFSQQDTFQSSGTVLASANGTASPNCTVSASGYDFSSTIWVGNSLHITAGTSWITTAGNSFHIILSTATGSDLVVTGPCGTIDALSGGTFYIGGSFSLNSTLDSDYFQAASSATNVAANKVWIKNGSYTLGESISAQPANGATEKNVVVSGYNATRGDNPTFLNSPLINVGANNIAFGSGWDMTNINFIGNAATVLNGSLGGKITNVKCANNSTTAGRVCLANGAGAYLYNDDLSSYRGIALNVAANNETIQRCYIHHSNVGIAATALTTSDIDHNLFETIISTAIQFQNALTTSGNVTISNNTIFGVITNPGTMGLTVPTASGGAFRAIGNIFANLNRAVVVIDTATTSNFDDYNIYYSTTAANSTWPLGPHSQTINPKFANVYEVSGTTATTTAGNHLVDTAANFTGWGINPGRDFLFLRSGTGTTNNTIYSIASVDSATQITTGETLTANATADKSYIISLGHDFRVGPAAWANNYIGLLGNTTGYADTGAFQHHDAVKAYAQ